MGRDVRSARRAAVALRGAPRGARRRCHATTSRCAARARDRAFHDQGITFSLSGEERPFPLDLVPRIIDADEWAVVEAGVRQRVARARALPRRRLRPGRDPRRRRRAPPPRRELVALPPLRRRARPGRRRAGPRRRHRPRARRRRQLPGARGQPAHAVGDLVRDREPAGDDARVPRAVRQPPHPPRRRLPAAARSRRCAPPRRPASTTRASWCSRPASTTPRTSSTRSSRARWASSWSRAATSCAATSASTCARPAGEQRVDVVYRRIDDDYLDPLHFRARLGARVRRDPQRGARRQRDDRQRAGQRRRRRQGDLPVRARDDRVLPRRGADPRQRRDVPARGPRGVRVGARAPRPAGVQAGRRLRRLRARDRARAPSEATLVELRGKVRANPRGWIAQEPVALSTAPTFVDGRMGAAPPRPAAVRGERRARRLGGARRARPGSRCPEGSLVVNSSQGGGSKDTWVLAAAATAAGRTPPPPPATRRRRSRRTHRARARPAARRTTQQQQQQQQQ